MAEIAVNQYPAHELSASDIFDLWKARSGATVFLARNSWYATAESYYYREEERFRRASQVYAMNSLGMPVLRAADNGSGYEMHRRYDANLVAPIVDDQQALLGQLPQTRILPPDNSEQGEKKAELETKYLISTWDLSGMDEHHPEAVLYTSMLGDGVLVAVPEWDSDHKDRNPRHSRVMIESVHPRFCFPSFYTGWRKNEVYDMIIAVRLPAKQIERDYGVHVRAENKDANVVITYLSPFQRTVTVGKLPTEHHVRWDLGLCPAVWIFNKQTGGKFGQADITHALPLQDQYERALTIAFDGMVEATYGIKQIINPDGVVGEGVDVGPGGVIETDDTTQIVLHNPNVKPEAAISLADLASKDLMKTAGTTQVRQEGDMHSSIVTGRAIHNAQGPQATRTDLKIKRFARALERINEAVLTVQERAPLIKDADLTLWGQYKGKEFRESFQPQRDIDGWVRNTVSFEKLIGQNLQQKTVTAMQMMASKLASPLTAMEMVGVEDPIGEIQKIRQARVEEAHAEAEIQQIMQGGGGEGLQQKVPGAPGISFRGPGGGAGAPPGSSAPPGSMMRPRGMMQQGPAGGMPKGATLEELRKALSQVVDKLKGHVYAVGELAREGQSPSPIIKVTAWEDYRVVKPVVEGMAPGADVKQMGQDKLPEMNELIV